MPIMLSLIRVATLTGILSVFVQGAVVLDGRQLFTDLPTVASATNSPPLPTGGTGTASIVTTGGTGAASIVTTGSHGIGQTQVTKQAMAFSPPLFTPIPIGTGSVESPGVGGAGATVEDNSTGEAGINFTPGASAVPAQLGKPVFAERITSQELTLQGASATPTTSTAPTVNTHPVALRG
ncbi:hypothetical protein EV421DRAFT_2023977 [Armillaria borealis]|uniref:Uncharacterized protein n=1 Tax=Armillaria borealis TaxID=47425 RepID=A0AA39IZ86_9AGAR|nr:hypothetical protein EV421DRAFT_2023977 [Armillaria borealis]